MSHKLLSLALIACFCSLWAAPIDYPGTGTITVNGTNEWGAKYLVGENMRNLVSIRLTINIIAISTTADLLLGFGTESNYFAVFVAYDGGEWLTETLSTLLVTPPNGSSLRAPNAGHTTTTQYGLTNHSQGVRVNLINGDDSALETQWETVVAAPSGFGSNTSPLNVTITQDTDNNETSLLVSKNGITSPTITFTSTFGLENNLYLFLGADNVIPGTEQFTLSGITQSAVRTPDPNCDVGHLQGTHCFRANCPQFGGPGCNLDCCDNWLEDNGPNCDDDGPPTRSCVIGWMPPTLNPTVLPTSSPTNITSRNPTKSPTNNPITNLPTSPTHRITISCPSLTPSSRRRGLLTETAISSLSMNDSCFAMEIGIKVENPLPDPSYIIRDVNVDVIKNALEQTLSDNNINGFNIIPIEDGEGAKRRLQAANTNDSWSVDDQCQHQDNSTKRLNFASFAFDISCINETMATNDTNKVIEWEFVTEDSIVYIWSIKSIITWIKINCQRAKMQANIYDDNGEFLGRSNVYNRDDINDTMQTFNFSNSSIILSPNSTYKLSINIFDEAECEENGYQTAVEFTPVILTRAEPSSCELGSHLAVDKSMIFGLASLCNNNNSNTSTKELFSEVLYKSHSSQQIIWGSTWNVLPERAVRRRLVSKGDGCGSFDCDSLELVWSDGTKTVNIMDDTLFPCYSQCLAIDEDTQRVFAVGGQQNGSAIDRLKVYKINSKSSGYLMSNYSNLSLDKPRAGVMCQFYKNKYDDNEYMMVINGVNKTDDLNDTNVWYNDIVFIPLDENNKKKLPKIQLKYNVIDMRPIITETNELYLFGGRDGHNAQNYIQVIDLDQVFNGSNDDTLTTMDRMEPMILNRVIPFVDFPTLENETCIMILGGQNYINNEWIDIEIPVTGLQLYCNEILVEYLKNQRRRLQEKEGEEDVNNVTFTQFDKQHLLTAQSNTYQISNGSTTVFMTKYNFSDDGIWYGFTVPFKVCFQNEQNLKSASNLLKNQSILDNQLKQNILIQSQINYKGWSYGYSKVNISNITISQDMTTISPQIQPTLQPTKAPTVGLEEWEITLIVIFSILGVILIGVIIYLIYKRIKKNESYTRASSNDIDDSDDPTDNEYVEDVDQALL